jgi:hypothetical protein
MAAETRPDVRDRLVVTPISWSVWRDGEVVGRVERDGDDYLAVHYRADFTEEVVAFPTRRRALNWLRSRVTAGRPE